MNEKMNINGIWVCIYYDILELVEVSQSCDVEDGLQSMCDGELNMNCA